MMMPIFFTLKLLSLIGVITCQKNWVVLFACMRACGIPLKKSLKKFERTDLVHMVINEISIKSEETMVCIQKFNVFSSLNIQDFIDRIISVSVCIERIVCKMNSLWDENLPSNNKQAANNNEYKRRAQQHAKHSFHLTCVKGLMINYNITLNSIVYDKI